MPMGDLDNIFPKKNRMDALDLEGLSDNDKIFVRSYYNQLLKQGMTNEEALTYANDKAYELRTIALRIDESIKYAKEKEMTDPRPERNLTGDVTVRRMVAFLKFMNAYSAGLSDMQVIEAIDNEWVDVIDLPVSKWDSDCFGLTLYMIGGGRIAQDVSSGMWLFLDEPEPQPLNTQENHSDVYDY